MGELRPNAAQIGLNLNSIVSQEVKPGQLTYALNAQKEFDGNVVTYQNEQEYHVYNHSFRV